MSAREKQSHPPELYHVPKLGAQNGHARRHNRTPGNATCEKMWVTGPFSDWNRREKIEETKCPAVTFVKKSKALVYGVSMFDDKWHTQLGAILAQVS